MAGSARTAARSRRRVSDSVGSSRTRTFDSSASAFAISSSWRSAVLSELTRADGSISAPTAASFRRAQGPPAGHRGPAPARHREDHVLGDREVFEDREVLVDDRQPEHLGGGGRGLRHDMAADLDRAPVGQRRAGRHRHQRRLPRAVLAYERVHLAGDDLEVTPLSATTPGYVLTTSVRRRTARAADIRLRPSRTSRWSPCEMLFEE